MIKKKIKKKPRKVLSPGLKTFLMSCGIPPRYLDSDINHPEMEGLPYVPKIKRYCRNLILHLQKGNGLILGGPYGAGKTALACVIAAETVIRGSEVWLIRSTAVKTLLIENPIIENKNGFVTAKEWLANVPMLIIDNLNKELSSEWSAQALEDVLRDRYERMKSTVITTNMKPAGLQEVLTRGSMSLIQSRAVFLAIEGMDWRSGEEMREEDL